MRSHTLVLILGVALMTGLFAMVIGCGSDNRSDNPVNYNDPEFVVIQDEVGRFVDSTLEFFANGMGTMYGLATDTVVDPVLYVPGPIDFETDSISSSYINGWHVVYIALNRNEFTSVLRDSIRFIKDGQPQQSANNIEDLLFRHFWSFNVTDTNVTHRDLVGQADYSFTDLNTTQATINGTDDWQADSKFVSTDSTVWRNITIEATVTNVKINQSVAGWVQSCPTSGTVSATIQMVYQKDDNDPVTSEWTVHITFNNGNVSTLVGRGENSWNYNTQLCTPPPTA